MRKITVKSKRMLADTYTPVSIYLRTRDAFPRAILLESTDFHHLENCYSFICLQPVAEFVVKQNSINFKIGDVKDRMPITDRKLVVDEFYRFIQSFSVSGNKIPFNGFFGYTSYNAVRYFENIELKKRDDESSIPDMFYALYRFIIAFNHATDEIIILENLFENEESELHKIVSIIGNSKVSTYPFNLVGDENSDITNSEYIDMVAKAKQHCMRGDVFQLVLSRRFYQKFIGDEFNVYRQLRSINPSPYLFYFDLGDFKIFGSSPEAQIEIQDNRAFINPIAGTYARTGDDEKDKELALQLSDDLKENAEHVMLVDLARNDLSRKCTDVKVESFKEIHFYSHVIHIVSKVSGQLPDNYNPIQLIADTFPAGTLTGAPKYKAMQLIDKYEKDERGYYGGCVGFIGFNGNVNMAIIIRTFFSKNNTLYYQAGAGIVSKSEEINELNEVSQKLSALKQAIQKANVNTHYSPLTTHYSLITNH